MDKVTFWISISANVVLFSLLISHECKLLSRDNECNQFYCNRLRLTIYKCGMAMLCLCLIFIATLTLGDIKYKQLNNYISFASTMSSTILSVLAIIMTINAEAKNENAKASVDISLNKMQEIAKDIKGYSDCIRQVRDDLNDSVSKIKELTKTTNTITDNTIQLKENVKEIKLTIDELKNMTSLVKEILERNDNNTIELINDDKESTNSQEFKIPERNG